MRGAAFPEVNGKCPIDRTLFVEGHSFTMPARKNRPDKFTGTPPKAPPLSALIKKLKSWERINPGDDHYVGWPDVTEAEHLEKGGYLRQGDALGCFFLTTKFKEVFGV